MRNQKNGTFTISGFNSDCTTELFNDSSTDRKSQAGTLGKGIQLNKTIKIFFCLS